VIVCDIKSAGLVSALLPFLLAIPLSSSRGIGRLRSIADILKLSSGASFYAVADQPPDLVNAKVLR
jgi:hypothetical protein